LFTNKVCIEYFYLTPASGIGAVPAKEFGVDMKLPSIIGIAAWSCLGVLNAGASTLTYNFGQVSGGTAPAGSPPWVQAVFTDSGLPADTVQLTLTAGNLAGGSFVSCWFFNLDPSLDPTKLSFSPSGSTGLFTDPAISTAANGFKAGPDGKFDILFSFTSTGDDSALFGNGDSLTYTITGLSGLTVDDFDRLSTCAGGSGDYASAAHIQSGPDGQGTFGWVNPTTISANADIAPNVPDSSMTIGLLGASLAGLGVFRKRMQARSSR
jgi:hypothetical protein